MQLNAEGNPSGSAIVLKPGPKRLDLKLPTSQLTNFKSSSGAKNQGPPLLCYKDTVNSVQADPEDVIRKLLAWGDHTPQLGEKGKKQSQIGKRSEPSGGLGKGKGSPFSLLRLASLAFPSLGSLPRRFFFLPSRLFSPFFPNAEPCPRLETTNRFIWGNPRQS